MSEGALVGELLRQARLHARRCGDDRLNKLLFSAAYAIGMVDALSQGPLERTIIDDVRQVGAFAYAIVRGWAVGSLAEQARAAVLRLRDRSDDCPVDDHEAAARWLGAQTEVLLRLVEEDVWGKR